MDVEADRRHPRKRNRPLASGALSLPAGMCLSAILVFGTLGASAWALPAALTGMLISYTALTLAYTFVFKERLLVDVVVLAGLYTLRVLAGGVAAEVEVSPWLLAFSTFFFLSLALLKRFVELKDAVATDREVISGRAYRVSDIDLVATMGIASGYASVLVLCLYISSDVIDRLYVRPEVLWLMCPVMLYWVSRVWMLAQRGAVHDDPVLFATTDKTSWICGAALALIVIGAAL